MGQSVTIACPPTWNLSLFGKVFEAIAHDRAATFSAFDNQLQLVAKDAKWILIASEAPDAAAVAEEYASNDDLDEQFRREAQTLRFFTIRFDDINVTRQAICAIAREAVISGKTAWIDTDYGWVIRAHELLERTSQDPCWDWRHGPTGNR